MLFCPVGSPSARWFNVLAPLVWVLAITGCGGSSSNTATAPTATARCAMTLRADAPPATAEGGTGTLSITVNRECPWEASSDASWITVTGARAGQGDATVTYTVAPNPQTAVRRGRLIVNEARAEITQAGAACSLALDASVGTVGPEGGTLRVSVTGLAGCPWTAASQASWVRVAAGAAGDGPGAVTLEVAANDGEPRTAAIVIAGGIYTVAQASAPSAPPTPSPTPTTPPIPGCAYAVQPTTLVVPAAGGTATVNVGTTAPCAWTATSTTAWLTVAGPAARQGPAAVAVTSAPNPDNAVRTGTLVVAGQTVLVVQEATAPPAAPPVINCSYSVAAPTQPIAAGGGGTVVNIVAPAGCAWTVTSTVDWLLVTSGAAGQGSGTASISSAANPGPSARTGTLIVAGQAVVVTQAGTTEPTPPCSFSVAPAAQSVGAGGGPGQLTITASAASCGWTATSTVPWLTVTSAPQGTGSGTASYVAAPNDTPTARSGTLSVAGQTVTITQDGTAPQACSYQLSPANLSVDAAGGEAATRLDTAVQCAWTATSQAAWITVVSASSGTGSADVRVMIAANPSASPRTGIVVIGGQPLQIAQAGAPEPPPTCTFTVAPPSQSFAATGGGGQVDVTASQPSCTWTVQSTVAWITLASPAQAAGSGVVSYLVAANDTTTARSATLTVAGQPIAVSQAGLEPAPCTYQLSPASLTVAAGGGDVATSLQTQTSCPWTATSQAPWITLTSPPSGSGSANIVGIVAPNTSTSSRTGTVIVAGQTLEVTQAGATVQTRTLEGSIGMFEGACPSVSFRVRGDRVVADAGTTYAGGTCSSLRNGLTVKVDGTPRADGAVLATRIEVLD